MLTTKGNPLVKGGSLFRSKGTMKIKMLKSVVAKGDPQKIGNIIEVDENEGNLLISYGDAEESTEKPKGKPKGQYKV